MSNKSKNVTKRKRANKEKARASTEKALPVTTAPPSVVRKSRVTPAQALNVFSELARTSTCYTFDGPAIAIESHAVLTIVVREWTQLKADAAKPDGQKAGKS